MTGYQGNSPWIWDARQMPGYRKGYLISRQKGGRTGEAEVPDRDG